MKILFIDVNCKNSSTGNIVYSLYSHCVENGIEAAVCYGRGKRIKEKNIYKFGLDLETCFHALLTRLTGFTGCFSFFSTKRLIRYIKRFRPDVVHIHELHAYFVNIKQLLAFLKKRGIKTVFTNHCEFLYTGKCGHAKECTRYSDNCGKCPHLRDYPTSLFFDGTKRMLETKRKLFEDWNDCFIVSPSRWLNSRMDASFLKNKKRTVIHNGIDIDHFILASSRTSGHENNKVVLSVAPNIMSELKGGERVIELARLFDRQNVDFVLVGDTTNYSKPLPPNVKVLPLISNKDTLIGLYNKADLFLICSSFENFPTTCIEAQCCGLPVCGFDVGGVSETILPGNGSVVEFGNLDALKNAILLTLSSETSKVAISNRSKKEFSNARMFENYLQLYKEFL